VVPEQTMHSRVSRFLAERRVACEKYERCLFTGSADSLGAAGQVIRDEYRHEGHGDHEDRDHVGHRPLARAHQHTVVNHHHAEGCVPEDDGPEAERDLHQIERGAQLSGAMKKKRSLQRVRG
jgi:hypothetical protein